jgi:hypothetical protein
MAGSKRVQCMIEIRLGYCSLNTLVDRPWLVLHERSLVGPA